MSNMLVFCLNPCSNGRYSQRRLQLVSGIKNKVLILVLMEDTLRVVTFDEWFELPTVLILVLMEDTLREYR